MKKLLVMFAVMTSISALAEKANFSVQQLQSPRVDGVIKLVIIPKAGGKLAVTYNPNHCALPNGPCTEMGSSYEVVEPNVIEDRRRVDGDLVLELTQDITLYVSIGRGTDGIVQYTAVVKKMGEQTFKMTPNVLMNLSR
jgi:hypothetical protein